MWNLPPPPGFQGLHPDRPLTTYHRRLPHWRQDGATYFVTFRLHDSLPQDKLQELADFQAEYHRRTPLQDRHHSVRRTGLQARLPSDDHAHFSPNHDELTRQIVRRIEQWLDEGIGSCLLRQPFAAAEVTQAMHHFDNKRYELECYVVMANHVHAILRPLCWSEDPLEAVLTSWKSYTSRRINRRLETTGDLWQEESFDRIIRDEEHLYRAIQYIGRNPAKAGLPPDACPLWLRPQWQELGWTFDNRPTTP